MLNNDYFDVDMGPDNEILKRLYYENRIKELSIEGSELVMTVGSLLFQLDIIKTRMEEIDKELNFLKKESSY